MAAASFCLKGLLPSLMQAGRYRHSQDLKTSYHLALPYDPQVLHRSDTLTTKLKTAWDYKLTMRTAYLGYALASPGPHAGSSRWGKAWLDWRLAGTLMWWVWCRPDLQWAFLGGPWL